MSTLASAARYYKNKKVLVTGGIGFIGSNLAISLVQAGADVTIVDARLPNTGANDWNVHPVSKDVSIITDNIHSEKLQSVIAKSEYIFNLAGVLSHIDALHNPLFDLQINTTDHLSFLLHCLKFNPDCKIIYTGTRNQYGKAQFLPVTEEHPFDPIDTNGVSEVAAEMYHHLYWKLYGLKSTSLRLCNVFGPRHQMKHSRQGVLNWFLRQILDEENVTLMGDGSQVRDCAYVDDVVHALLLLGSSNDSWGKAFNIGSFPVSLKTFVETAISVANQGSYSFIPFTDDRQRIEPGDYIADFTLLSKTVGWKPDVSLEDALAKTFEYYRTNKEHYWENT